MDTQSNIRLLTDILGTKILNPEGEDIGVIQNIMIDTQNNDVIYLVLCYANFLGNKNRLCSISSNILKSKSGCKNKLILKTSLQQLFRDTATSKNILSEKSYDAPVSEFSANYS